MAADPLSEGEIEALAATGGIALSPRTARALRAHTQGSPLYVKALLDELPQTLSPGSAVFLPYLSGERTPHNHGAVRGAFAGLSQGTSRAALTQAVLEGVAFSLRDCLDALAASGTHVAEADLIGGGSRSRAWAGIIASVLGIPLHRSAEGERGGAFGAARLARLALSGEDPRAGRWAGSAKTECGLHT